MIGRKLSKKGHLFVPAGSAEVIASNAQPLSMSAEDPVSSDNVYEFGDFRL